LQILLCRQILLQRETTCVNSIFACRGHASGH